MLIRLVNSKLWLMVQKIQEQILLNDFFLISIKEISSDILLFVSMDNWNISKFYCNIKEWNDKDNIPFYQFKVFSSLLLFFRKLKIIIAEKMIIKCAEETSLVFSLRVKTKHTAKRRQNIFICSKSAFFLWEKCYCYILTYMSLWQIFVSVG